MNKITNCNEILSQPLSKKLLHEIVDLIYLSPQYFEDFFQLISSSQQSMSWRSAWICQKVFEKYPYFLSGREKDLISLVMNCKYSGTKRILLSILLLSPSPHPLPIDFLDFCMNRMLDTNEAIAVQSLCIKMAYKLCLCEPDLLPELKLYLEHTNIEYYSPAVKSCVRNVLKKIN